MFSSGVELFIERTINSVTENQNTAKLIDHHLSYNSYITTVTSTGDDNGSNELPVFILPNVEITTEILNVSQLLKTKKSSRPNILYPNLLKERRKRTLCPMTF